MQPTSKQLDLDDKERAELLRRVLDDWTQDSIDLEDRATAMTRWTQLAAARLDPQDFPEHEASNFHVPLILWQILSSVSTEMSVLFGEDSEIYVIPRGPSDFKRKEKIKRWMTWRIRESLHLIKKYYAAAMMKRQYGTLICCLTWKRKTRKVIHLVPKTIEAFEEQIVDGLVAKVPVEREEIVEEEKEVVEFEGLDFQPENIEDWAVPKSARTLEDADRLTRKLFLSVSEVLDLRDQGKLDAKLFEKKNSKGESELLEKLYGLAEGKKTETAGQDSGKQVREEKDAQSGQPTIPLGRESRVVILNWFGKFRFKGKGAGKSERAEDVVAFVSEDLNQLLGACRLVDIFPDGRLPFLKDDFIPRPNRFWGIGLPELLESINREMDAIHNIVIDAGMVGVGPMIGYKPLSGFKAEKFRYEPWMCLPLNDPANDIRVIAGGQINLGAFVVLMPQLLAMAERLTGHTEAEMGRQFSGPNAPRTMGQQSLLEGKSQQRLFLDLMLSREFFREVLRRIWDADKRWLPKPYFFRVTEESPEDVLTAEDMAGDYDFDITPPTAVANRAQLVQETLQAYALTLQNPLAQQNPALLAQATKTLYKRLNQDELAALVPDVSQLAPPQSAEQENVRLLQGEDIDPHPADNHGRHLAHHGRLEQELADSAARSPLFFNTVGGPNALAQVRSHIAEHEQAMKTRGGSINMMGRGAPTQGGVIGGAQPQMPQLGMDMMGGQGQGATNPATNPAQNALAGLLNQGGTNLG